MQNEVNVRRALRVFNNLTAHTAEAPDETSVVSAKAICDVLRWILEETNGFAEFLEGAEPIVDQIEAEARTHASTVH